ncbi:MAG: hypothetical protein ABIO16_04930 [Nocardioides sp.]
MPDEPSLELLSLFKRKRRSSAPPVEDPASLVEEGRSPVTRPREPRGPVLAPLLAAWLTGAVVGLVGSGLVWLALRGCSSLRGTSSCGGPGLLLVLAIFVVMVIAGRVMLGLLGVPDAGSTALLAVALVAVLCLLFVDRLDSTLGAAWLAVVGVLAFGLSQWVTSTFTEAGERPR